MSDPQIRASDAERDATIERLRAAAGEGRLTLEELADRIEGASGARVTRGELTRLTADLPPEAAPSGGGAAGALGPGAAAGGGLPAGAGVAVAPVAVSSVFGDHRRSGLWQLPQRSRWRTVFGDVKLDLREAHVPAGAIEVDVSTVFGDVELLVPEGVLVEIRTRTTFGDVKQRAGGSAPPGAPRIVLTGGTIFGDVRVQARRLRERLVERLLGPSA
ncbi:DUF1707 SHOCT-like domain-containing protein [Conexibacter arvalis]|uniref:Cell wall-active antibiotics response LiaF-like C-terminal domain-containing protein n=1 Tax=Conexibacter arvalis TaxID=912552 RepID=A0A840IIV3_9ACTN|nr:DUF1707 domain-containing protein [Conexibacter arvalis]MBB4664912.1 hypothetical protein [Conexibacter arvalis]